MTAIGFALITAALFGAAPIPARLGLARVDPGLGLVVRTFAVATVLPAATLSWQLMDTRSMLCLAGEGVLASVLRTWPTSMPCGRAKPPKWSPWWPSCWESSCWAKRPRLTAGSEPPSLWWG